MLLALVVIDGAAKAGHKFRDVVEEGRSTLAQVAVQIMRDNDAGQASIVDRSRAQVVNAPGRYVPAGTASLQHQQQGQPCVVKMSMHSRSS